MAPQGPAGSKILSGLAGHLNFWQCSQRMQDERQSKRQGGDHLAIGVAVVLAASCGPGERAPALEEGPASAETSTGESDGTETGDGIEPDALSGTESETGTSEVPEDMAAFGGAYFRGDDSQEDAPRTAVELTPFAVELDEVTVGDWRACLDALGCSPPDDACPESTWWTQDFNLPISCVTWGQAAEYCAWAGRRLPTEAEWEIAARGDDERPYPWGVQPPTCERVSALECADAPEAVGSHSPEGDTAHGLRDMAGSVAEWTADWYEPEYYTTAPLIDPSGPASGEMKAYRGGSVEDGLEADALRSYVRRFAPPLGAQPGVGLRCAISLEEGSG